MSGPEKPDGGMSRRDALLALGAVPLARLYDWREGLGRYTGRPLPRPVPETDAGVASGAYELRFFTPHEFETVRVLMDIIIPRDERSGSATDSGAAEWVDGFFADPQVLSEPRRLAMRGGLAWVDRETHRRFAKTFVQATPAERIAIVEDIAWPARARPEMSQGVAFFNGFRDMTASAFWSSEMGVKDLGYIGNVYLREWSGCPEPALRKLGVSYGD